MKKIIILLSLMVICSPAHLFAESKLLTRDDLIPEELKNLSPEEEKIKTLTPKEIKALSPDEVQTLTSEQIKVIYYNISPVNFTEFFSALPAELQVKISKYLENEVMKTPKEVSALEYIFTDLILDINTYFTNPKFKTLTPDEEAHYNTLIVEQVKSLYKYALPVEIEVYYKILSQWKLEILYKALSPDDGKDPLTPEERDLLESQVTSTNAINEEELKKRYYKEKQTLENKILSMTALTALSAGASISALLAGIIQGHAPLIGSAVTLAGAAYCANRFNQSLRRKHRSSYPSPQKKP